MTSRKKRFATYALAATAAVGSVGGLMAAGAGAQGTDGATTTTPAEAKPARGGKIKVDDVAVAAPVLGMEADALRTELRAGKSIAQVAQAKGVDVQKVVDALVAARTKAIDEAVAVGRITQAAADARKTGLAARVREHVERVGGKGGPGGGRGAHGPGARIHELAVVAPVVGLDVAALRTELQAGKSLAQVAQAKGVDVQKVVDALVAARTKAIDEAVAAGRIPQAQADARKADLPAHVREHVERVRRGGDKGGPGGRRGPR